MFSCSCLLKEAALCTSYVESSSLILKQTKEDAILSTGLFSALRFVIRYDLRNPYTACL
jgi:hypothetical protein